MSLEAYHFGATKSERANETAVLRKGQSCFRPFGAQCTGLRGKTWTALELLGISSGAV